MGKASIIPFGPQHPVLPEPLHLDLVVEDEVVIEATPQIGFVHRGLERLVQTKDYIYIFEFKRDGSAQEALSQIDRVGYDKPYAADPRQLFKIGVNFDSATRMLTDWKTA